MGDNKTSSRSGVAVVVNLFASVKLTVVLLITIAALSFLGVMGKLPDVHHTRYFNLLLGLLFINLLICTLDRLPSIYRRIKLDAGAEAPPPPREPDYVIRVGKDEILSVLTKAEKILFGPRSVSRREMEWKTGKEKPSTLARVAFKATGKWSLIGPQITHLGILLIIIGAIIGGQSTVEGSLWLRPGEQQDHLDASDGAAIELGFTVRCNDFRILMNPGGAGIKDWLCDLSIIKAGAEVARKVIEVNKPLSFEGFGIYQSDWRTDESSRVLLTATSLADGSTLSRPLGFEEPWTLAGTSVSFMIADYEPHSEHLDQDLGQRLVVIRYQGETPVEEFTLFEKKPGFDPYYQSGLAFLEPGEQTDEIKSYFFQVPIALGFSLRMNDFQVDAQGKVKANVSVIAGNEEKLRSETDEERPLHYQGFVVLPGLIEPEPVFQVFAVRAADGATFGEELEFDEVWTLPGSSIGFAIVSVEPHAAGMGKNFGTKLTLIKYEHGRPVSEFFLFEQAAAFDARRKGDFQLSFKTLPAPGRKALFLIREDETRQRLGPYDLNFKPLLMTGLRLVRDPGVRLTWTGSGLLVFGVMFSLFIHHRRVWLVALGSGAGVELLLIGRSKKAQAMFNGELAKKAQKLAEELNGDIINSTPKSDHEDG